MRVLRVVLGILTLLLAMPVLVAGALGWWTMQHRSPDGAFQANLAPISAENRVVVVPDVDAILRRDAPFARADQTELRLTAGPDAFVGMAVPADLAAYLAGADYTEISGFSLGRGPLAVESRTITATDEPLALPSEQPFWVRGGTGELRWAPTTDRDRDLALIIIAPPGDTPVNLSVALTAGWLTSTTWGLLILGPVLLLLGLAALAWPQRPREIVYVVDTPTAAHAGLPLPAPRSFPQALPAQSRPSTPALPASSAYRATPASPASPCVPADPASPGSLYVPGFPASPGSPYAPAVPTSPGSSCAPAVPASPASPNAPGVPASPASLYAAAVRDESLSPFGPAVRDECASLSGAAAPASPVSPLAVSAPSGLAAPSATPTVPAPSSGAFAPAGGTRAGTGIPVAGGMPSASAYLAVPVSSGAPVSLPTQLALQPSSPELLWPPAESPTTTEPAREIPTQEFPLVDAEHPMPSAGVQLHLAKPQ